MKLRAVFNRDGGTFKTTDMERYCAEATEIFSKAGHDLKCTVSSGQDIMSELERAAGETGVEGLIAGGGDGTISAAAGVAWKAGIPLGVVPAGTMNLFSRSLKLPLDIWKVLDALAASSVQSVDIGTVNGRPFVHQFSAGLHARMVRMRDAMTYGSRLGKISANTRAALGVMFNPPDFDVVYDMDGDGRNEHRHVSAISVSNNPFGANPLLVADDITTGQLGVYLADSLTPSGVARLTFDILRGRMKENQAVTASTARMVKLHFPKHRKGAACVVDGELLRMPRDVEVKVHPGELKVLAVEPLSTSAVASNAA
ncbi:diacylglycerol kinase family protein [Rhizobium sp. RU36D]|uniref:diacylglycerol/lipid kinase family protein n=1 Tax=Rhizobium sp. RU36D TaxID=1907415 RepID=UPI0009D88BB8|nr:diacylglycerol kinase family protein [Rhizobium sp. RU36D]SMD11200.1 Diacylglycerol kinase family enzyme [Rhizobium sp. RU36D]